MWNLKNKMRHRPSKVHLTWVCFYFILNRYRILQNVYLFWLNEMVENVDFLKIPNNSWNMGSVLLIGSTLAFVSSGRQFKSWWMISWSCCKYWVYPCNFWVDQSTGVCRKVHKYNVTSANTPTTTTTTTTSHNYFNINNRDQRRISQHYNNNNNHFNYPHPQKSHDCRLT